MDFKCSRRHLATVLVLLLLLFSASGSYGASPAGYSEFYIPGDEDILGQVFSDIGAAGGILPTAARHTVINVVAWSPNTTIYYDHWEDGYDFDPNNPTTADETVVLVNKGDSRTFESSNIPVNPRGTNIYYDGRDRIYVAGGTVTVTRESWVDSVGTVFQIAWEVYPVRPQMTVYILPFGDDLAGAPRNYLDFRRVFATVQATKNGTVVTFDVNNDGVYGDIICTSHSNPCTATATQVTLNAGDVFLLDRFAALPTTGTASLTTGTKVLGSETLQVNYIIGDQTANYEARGFSAFPRGFWDDEYYAPVPTDNGADFPTQIYLYNPQSTDLTVTYETSSGSGSFIIPAGQTRSFSEMTGGFVPEGSGVYFKGSDTFWGISTIDQEGQAHEWGYSLLPAFLLDNEHFLGWALGAYPATIGEADDSGIFITPALDNTRVFIDTNHDGTPDQTYTLNRLQTQYVYDAADGDLSNTNIWATGPVSIAFGQNPDTSPAGTPSIDLGYTVLPAADFVDKVLTVQKSANPVVVATAAGSQSTYTLVIDSYRYPVDNVVMQDTLPGGWQYVNNSTTITLADKTTVSGAAANPTISGGGLILTWPSSLLHSMAPNQQITIIFTAQTTAVFTVGAITRNIAEATGTRTVGGVTQTFVATEFAFNTYGDLTVTKTSNAATPLYPGDQFTYTVNVTNPSASAITGVSIYDPLPDGVSYVAGSGSVTCQRLLSVRDEFATAAYTNNGPNNTASWAGNWTETDIHGTVAGAGGGFVLVTGGVLQLRDQTSNYADNFTTNVYTRNDGTNNWSGPWTETGDDGTAGGGSITVDAGNNNRVNFGAGAAGRAITRTAAVSGGSVTISFTLSDQGIDNGEGVIAEYDLGLGAGYQFIQQIDNNTLTGTNPLTVNTAGATSITLRFRTFGTYTGGDAAGVDTVNIAVNEAVGSRIQRTVDLTGASNPQLNFSYASANLEAGDTMVVEAGSSAAGPFTTLATFAGGVPNVAPPYDLTPYISATTTIRFRITGGYNVNNETFSIDNVDISYRTFASGIPPDFLSRAMGCSILPGNTLTLTYSVIVDNPLATGIEQITNIATVNSNEITLPNASVTNIVVNPSSGSAEIISYVWLDADGDRIKDVGEPGLPNIEVTLKDQFGTPIATAVTDGTGRYVFSGITPGNGYYVEVTSGTLPSGLTQSAPAGHSDNRTSAFNLTAGQSYTTADLGYKPAAGTATFGDLVWSDANGNGIRDLGEPGLAGVAVQLWLDVNKNGAIDAGTDTLVASTNTAVNGSYLFTGVAASGTEDYIVFVDSTQAALTGFSQTTTDRNVKNVSANSVFTNLDMGFSNSTGTFSVRDRIWNDANKDSQDDSESGIGGVTVDLLDASLNVIATTITDASGYYLFSGVIGSGADYTIRITDAGGILTDYFGITSDAIAGEAAINNLNGSLDFTVEPAEPHFGYSLNKSIGGTAFNDLDGNGVQNAGELGMSGVTVRLYNDVNSNGLLDGGDTLKATLVTDGNGNYLFSGLTDGNYIVSIPTPPAAYTYTTESPDNDLAAGSQQAVVISGGNNVLNLNFGYQAIIPRSVSGTLWEDADADGVIDAGERRFQGVTLEVLEGSTVIAFISTDANGNYVFPGLTTNTYTVRISDAFGVLAGYTDVYENDGALDGAAVLNLIGADATGVRFGFRLPGVTLVTLSNFRAYAENGRVRIEWSTSYQRNTAGFYLLRRDDETGKYLQINRSILPALLSSPQGGTYSLIDNGASLTKSSTYVLVEKENRGRKNAYGPFTVMTGGGNSLENGYRSDPPAPEILLSGKSDIDRKSLAAKTPQFTDNDGTLLITLRGSIGDRAADSVTDEFSGYSMKPREISAGKLARLLAAQKISDKARYLRKLRKGDMAKISVDREGFYYIGADEIAPLLGISEGRVKDLITEGRLAMRSQGRKVAYIPADDYSGIFFYGQGMDSLYTKENIYWLYKGEGLQMKHVEGTGPSPVGQGAFTETVHMEEDTMFNNIDVQNSEDDYWFWSYLYVAPDFPDYASASFVIRTDSVANSPDTATLTVNLKGFTDTDANPDHHIRVSLNGTVIGEGTLNGTDTASVVIPFDQGLLYNGDNTILVEALLDAGVSESAFYLDSFDLTYQRLYEAGGNYLAFRSEGTQPMTVYGFASSSISVFDVTDPLMPLVDHATTIQDEGGSFSVSFIPSAAGARYIVMTPDAAITGVNAWADTPSHLSAKRHAADYIIIAPDQLYEAAQVLADYRKGQGYAAKVIHLEDIMDEFNYGISSPQAIHDFLAHAYYHWETAPRYVVLAGNGTYDYRDNTGKGDNLVPIMIVSTPYGVFPSDNYFADVDGDHVPDMAIGRLPVLTAGELQDMVNKIITFEHTVGNKVMMLTDNADFDGDYPSDSDDIARYVPAAFSMEKWYMPDYSAGDIRDTLLYGITDGTFLLNYMGHGNPSVLAEEGLLSIPDVDTMENTNRLFVLAAMSCAVGEFAFPGDDSLSEALVLKRDGGAVAVLSPSGLSLNALSKTLDEGFFSDLFSHGRRAILGDSIRKAFKFYKRSGGADFTLDIYNLLGDPALRVRLR